MRNVAAGSSQILPGSKASESLSKAISTPTPENASNKQIRQAYSFSEKMKKAVTHDAIAALQESNPEEAIAFQRQQAADGAFNRAYGLMVDPANTLAADREAADGTRAMKIEVMKGQVAKMQAEISLLPEELKVRAAEAAASLEEARLRLESAKYGPELAAAQVLIAKYGIQKAQIEMEQYKDAPLGQAAGFVKDAFDKMVAAAGKNRDPKTGELIVDETVAAEANTNINLFNAASARANALGRSMKGSAWVDYPTLPEVKIVNKKGVFGWDFFGALGKSLVNEGAPAAAAAPARQTADLKTPPVAAAAPVGTDAELAAYNEKRRLRAQGK
jgi:hypothetical protein